MTGIVRQKIKEKLNNDKKQLRQNWEGYHLLEFATTIRPVKQDTKRRKELDDFLDSNGIGGFEALQKLPSDNSAFTTEKSEGVFESLAAFLDIPTFVCFLNFLEFCRNSKPRRPLDVFDGENKISIEIDDECKVVTLDNAIDGFKKHAKAAEEEFRRKSSQNKSEHSDPIQPQLTIPEAKEGNKNYYANAALVVIGRKKQKDRLKAFLNCDLNVAWFQLAGAAGQGKSRLAFDLLQDASENQAWRAGFLWENNIELFKDQWRDWQPDKPHLLIFDYVIGREHVIKPIIQTLISKKDQFQHKIRILLVERQRWDGGNQINLRNHGNDDALGLSMQIGYKANWYRNLCEDSKYRDSDLPCRFEDGIEELMELDKDDLVTIIKQLFSGEELTIPDDELKEALKRIDGSGRPLYAYLLAQQLSETQEGYQNWTKIDLLNKQLERDKRRWEKAFWKDDKKTAPIWGDDHPAMKLAVLATMVRGVEFQDKRLKEYFGNIDSSIRREAVAITSGNLVNDDIRPRAIGALEPDLLGTWFVLYCFHNDLEFDELLDVAWQCSSENTAIFLLRITQDFIDLPGKYKILDVAEKMLAHRLPHKDHYHAMANVVEAIIYSLYQRKLAIPENLIIALEHAVNSYNFDAMNFLGFLYGEGIGVTKNPEISVGLYRRAADLGDSRAMVNLGFCYDEGKGVDRDLIEAVRLYRQAAVLGDSRAMVSLGLCYEKGEGVNQDSREAVRLYRQAVNLGDSQAMFNLGLCYQEGEGVNQDLSESVRLYRQAADLGNSRAMVNLGLCFEKGDGVEKNLDEAAYLYRQADKAGDKSAIDYLQTILLLQNFLDSDCKKTQKNKIWPNNKPSHLIEAPTFDPPIMVGDWKYLSNKEMTDYLDKVIIPFKILELVDKLDGYFGQYARLLPLNFYKDCNLVEVQLYNPLNKKTLIFSAIFNKKKAILLNGRSDIIHNLNPYLLTLGDKKSTIDYLRFFWSYTRHRNDELIQIISNPDEVPFNKEKNHFTDDDEDTSFYPQYIEGCFETEGWQKFNVTMLHRYSLFDVTLKLFSNGDISIKNSFCYSKNLPILRRKFDGVFRTPLQPPNDL